MDLPAPSKFDEFHVISCFFVFCFEVKCGLIKTEQLKILQQSALGQNQTRAIAKVSDFFSGCRATKWCIGGAGYHLFF